MNQLTFLLAEPPAKLSIAGLRGGMDDERGNLALEFLRLADRLRPRWLLWENVPGVLSSNGGRDFGSFLGGLGQLGYGFAYRSLDAQFFGLAQRRKRVFVVGYLGDWRPAGAVLLEPESLRGNPPPRREARKNVAGTISASLGGCDENDARDGRLIADVATTLRARDGAKGVDSDCTDTLIAAFGGNNSSGPIDVATALNAHGGPCGRQDFESETFIAHALRAEGFDASEDGTGRGTPIVPAAFPGRMSSTQCAATENLSPAIGAKNPTAVASSAVRRLTPRECERLQGFPDDFTAIPYRGGVAADGPRYKALGNSMAVPVMRWIGERIAAADRLL